MRRKPDALIPFEKELIEAAIAIRENGHNEFYGFQIAETIKAIRLRKQLKELQPSKWQRLRATVGYGTLYRALDRLRKMGVLQSRWEELPPGENRPRRRYYHLTEGK